MQFLCAYVSLCSFTALLKGYQHELNKSYTELLEHLRGLYNRLLMFLWNFSLSVAHYIGLLFFLSRGVLRFDWKTNKIVICCNGNKSLKNNCLVAVPSMRCLRFDVPKKFWDFWETGTRCKNKTIVSKFQGPMDQNPIKLIPDTVPDKCNL